MGTANGEPEYKVTVLDAAAKKFRDLAIHAAERGLLQSFTLDLEKIDLRLRWNPSGWGDPLFDYHQLGMTHRRGTSGLLCVYYSVNEPGRAAFVQDVEPNPFGPLAIKSGPA